MTWCGNQLVACPLVKAQLLTAPTAGQGLFSFGFCIAALYHWCQMEPTGLQHSAALGCPGPFWRTLDISFAQWLLARTFGHIVAAKHPVTVGEAFWWTLNISLASGCSRAPSATWPPLYQ